MSKKLSYIIVIFITIGIVIFSTIQNNQYSNNQILRKKTTIDTHTTLQTVCTGKKGMLTNRNT
jgi:hypothetical protein